MNWTIIPGMGIGPLRFGMTPDQVAQADAAIGPAHHSDPAFDGSVRETRGDAVPSFGYRDGRLIDADCAPGVPNVRFEDLDLFRTDPEIVIRRLYERNGGALAGVGSVLFLRLGINTGGFYDIRTGRFKHPADGEDDYRTLAAFAPGAFDALLGEMRPIELPAATR